MENPIEDQDQMFTSSTSTSSSERSLPVENVHVEFSEFSNAANATESNERVTGQASNTPGDVEVDTGIRQQRSQVYGNQPPVYSGRQPSTNEDLSLKQALDVEKKSQYYCGVCMENVQVNECCQRAAHKECLYKIGLGHTNCNCFQRERIVNSTDYPDSSTSASKQPSSNDDLSGTWEEHPLQTFSQHSEVLSLCCEICGKEEVYVKSLCCNSEYHQHCLNQCRERGHTTCLYCRCTMQPLPQMNCPLRRLWGGRRNAGGGDGSGSNGGGRGRGGGGGEGGEVGAVEGVVVGGGVAGGGGGGGEGGELGAVGGVVVGGGVAGGGGQEKGGEGRGHHGGKVDVNSLGENNHGGGGDGEGGSEIMEGDEGDPGGGVSGGGLPLPSLQQLFLFHCQPRLPPHSPSAYDRDEEEGFERRVDDQGGNKNSGHYEGDEY